MSSQRGNFGEQSAAVMHSPEQSNPPSGPSRHTELEQALPLSHASRPLLPIPRAPGLHSHVPSHSQRSAAWHSRLKLHAAPASPGPYEESRTAASDALSVSSAPASSAASGRAPSALSLDASSMGVVPPSPFLVVHATKAAVKDAASATKEIQRTVECTGRA